MPKMCCRCGLLPGLYSSKCGPCAAAYKKEWRKRHPEKQRISGMNPEEKAKAKCRMDARNALHKGHISKDPCWTCGALKTEMHHPDYSRPLQMVWLCRPCHLIEHSADLKKGRNWRQREAASSQ